MSIVTDVKNDIKSARGVHLRWWLLLAMGCLAFIGAAVFDKFGELNMALPTFNSVFLFIFVVSLKWELRSRVWFWVTIGFLVTIHVLLIWYIPWTSRWIPALAVAVISSVDFCMILLIIAGVRSIIERQFLSGS